MTLEEYKDKHHVKIHLWAVEKLRADKEFMKDSRDCEDGRDWALRQKPDLKHDKQPKMKFLGLDHSKVPVEPETPQIAPEPVEEISKTAKIMKDLKALRKKKGFL